MTRPATHLTAATFLTGLAALAFTLAHWPPQLPHPICPIHQMTGLLCPGCGTTRALTALTHGNLLAALHLNPFTILLLPVALAYAIVAYRKSLQNQPMPTIPKSATYTVLAIATAFTLARNL